MKTATWNKNVNDNLFVKKYNVRLFFYKKYCIVNRIENEIKQSVLPPFTLWCIQTTPRLYVVRLNYGGGAMIEVALIKITYLLFYGIVGMAIINVALAITILILLHRQ